MTFLVNGVLVAVGGFFGAISRFGVSQWVNWRLSPAFPVGTLVVNLLGALLLGVLIGSGIGDSWQKLLGTGFMGAFTTFSTFKLESIQLGTHRRWKSLVIYLAVSYIGGIFLAFLGLMVGMK